MFELKSLPVILDGAVGTELQKRGMPAGQASSLWALEHPEVTKALFREYLAAGSNIVYAPTFTANRVSLAGYGMADRVEDINMRLVEYAREATEGKLPLGGDIAPTGRQLVPYGDMEMEELIDVYAEQAAALDKAGVDFFVIETQMFIGELRAAILGVRRVSEKPIIASFTAGESGKTIFGGDLTSALAIVQSMGVSAFGLNCVYDLDMILKTLTELKKFSRIPLIAKPNAGLPRTVDGQAVYDMVPETMAEWAVKMHGAGADLIGGCCGTGPEHIAAMAKALDGATANVLCEAPPELCATERRAFPVPQTFVPVGCTEDLSDDAEDAEDNGAEGIALYIADDDALGFFLEAASSLDLPIQLDAADEALMEKALIRYHGRAVLAPETKLGAEFTDRMASVYGLIK